MVHSTQQLVATVRATGILYSKAESLLSVSVCCSYYYLSPLIFPFALFPFIACPIFFKYMTLQTSMKLDLQKNNCCASCTMKFYKGMSVKTCHSRERVPWLHWWHALFYLLNGLSLVFICEDLSSSSKVSPVPQFSVAILNPVDSHHPCQLGEQF